MPSLQLDLTPYVYTAVALIIIGLASVVYLLHLKEKTAALGYLTFGLASFTASMACMLAGSVVVWGSAFAPLTDACAVLSMAAVIEFGYHYPERVRSLEAYLARVFAITVSGVALAISLTYAYQILIRQAFQATVPGAYWLLNPLTFVAAVAVGLRRTLAVQRNPAYQQPGVIWRAVWHALWQPQGSHARLLRNFSLALSLGLIQGLVTAFNFLLPGWLAIWLLNLSLLLMLVAVVYASLDLPPQPPGLVVRLVGLSLITLLGLLVVAGIANFQQADAEVSARTRAAATTTGQAAQAGQWAALPANVVYVVAWPADSAGKLVYAREPGFDPRPISQGTPTGDAQAAVWGYFIQGDLGAGVRFRYGDHPLGSVHAYATYPVQASGQIYEVGFSLAEMSAEIWRQGQDILWAILGGSLFILLVFPVFFRTTLIQPLEHLLAGVRQVDAGRLDIVVPVTYPDEIGFLTAAFNKTTAARQIAETELRQLNLTLETRVAERTHGLEALYDISAAASHAHDPQTLPGVLLERTLGALRCSTGFILWGVAPSEEPAVTTAAGWRLVAEQGLPPEWSPHLATLAWATTSAASLEPLLIADVTSDPRAPAFMRQGLPLTLMLAPLQAEGQALGLLGLARPVEERFHLDEVALLVSIAGQVGVVLHTDQLRQAAQQARVLEERERLARDLHDSVTQSLYGLVTLTEAGLMWAESRNLEATARTLTRIGQTARQAIREIRLFLHQLRPSILEQEGLVSALELRLAAVEGRADVETQLLADESLRLPPPVETAFYHIAQEALNNALKHARASTVTVSLQRIDPSVVLEIADNGGGFDPAQPRRGGMGLGNMHARAQAIGAALEIASSPGQGTRVRVLLEVLP
jgi:signal transduction histidine kinase